MFNHSTHILDCIARIPKLLFPNMDILALLELYRDEENPDVSGTYVDEEHIMTLSKDELIKQTNHLKIDILKVCRLGMIDPQTENLCKLFYCANRHEARKKEPAKRCLGHQRSRQETMARRRRN